MLLTARLDTEISNQAVSDGTMPKLIEGLLEELKPESVYFTSSEGDRTCFLVFDLKDASGIPAACEPFFHAGAKVSLKPVMTLDDLNAGMAALER
jgi:hypothetical protein